MQPEDASPSPPEAPAEVGPEPTRPAASATSSATFTAEIETAALALERAVDHSDLRLFYEVFRQTSLPWIGIIHRHDPSTAVRWSVEVVKRLGSISPAVALAVENHLYVVAAIATLGLRGDGLLEQRRLAVLESIGKNRWLVANTNSRIHGNRIAKANVVVEPIGDRYRVRGEAAYLSLASEGDLLVFLTFFATGEAAILYCPLKNNPQIEIGPLLFPNAMQDSDTRRITFKELELEQENLLFSGRDGFDILGIVRFELSWHQVLLAALSLGTAARAIEEGRLFLRSIRQPNGEPLAQLDGMVVDMGRQVLALHAASGAVERAGRVLSEICHLPTTPRQLEEAFELACAAKYISTRCAEEVVGVVRRIIGARSFVGGHPMERLSQEVLFAQLGGEVNAFIERQVGERALRDRSFLKVVTPQARQTQQALEKMRRLAQARKQDPKGSAGEGDDAG